MPVASIPFEPPRYILAPYVATPHEVVDRMLALAEVTAADVVYDLGCGDGRIPIAAAKLGASGVGVDIERYWIEQANSNALAAGVADRTEFAVGDAMDLDVSAATVVTLYLVEWSTERIRPVLERGLRAGARIVSHSFAMQGPDPVTTERWVDATGETRTIRLWVR